MPRKRRTENKGLPTGWRLRKGAYYYQVPPKLRHLWNGKTEFRLGKTLPEAYAEWAKRVAQPDNIRTIGQLLDMYAARVTPQKAKSTQELDREYLKKLRPTFGHMSILDILPMDAYSYHHRRAAKTSAKNEIALLRHAFSKAVEWGLIAKNPLRGEVRLPEAPARDRLIADWEIQEFLSLPVRNAGDWTTPLVQSFTKLKLITLLRNYDILQIKTEHLLSEGIYVEANKTKKRMIIGWTDMLREIVDEALHNRPVDISPYLLCDRRGKSLYNHETGKAENFKGIWARYMKRAQAETKLVDSFASKDLRAKGATDLKDKERAKEILQHSSMRTTERHYLRDVPVIKPVK